MTRTLVRLAPILMLLLAGCVALQRGSPVAQQVRNRPIPINEAGRAEECAWIRSEIKRQQDVFNQKATLSTAVIAACYRVSMEENVAALLTRAAEDKCAVDTRYAQCGWHPLCWTF